MLIFSDGYLPLPVINASSMTNRQCWRVANYGNQGEGLIQGSICDPPSENQPSSHLVVF